MTPMQMIGLILVFLWIICVMIGYKLDRLDSRVKKLEEKPDVHYFT